MNTQSWNTDVNSLTVLFVVTMLALNSAPALQAVPGDNPDANSFTNRIFDVTTLADGGVGSLRQTITDAPAGSTIHISASGTLLLTSGELAINKDLAIVGPGTNNLVVSGNNASRVFNIASNVTAALSGMTIANGHAPDGLTGTTNNLHYEPWIGVVNPWDIPVLAAGGPGGNGGGILTAGTLTMSDCTINKCGAGLGGAGISVSTSMAIWFSNGGPGGSGGGIHNSGTLTLVRCTLISNVGGKGASGIASEYDGSGIGGDGGLGGGIYNAGQLFMTFSTISSNATAPGTDCTYSRRSTRDPGRVGNGGGIYNANSMSLTNCTLIGNTTGNGCAGGGDNPMGRTGAFGGDGGGIFTSGNAVLMNCTLSGNTTGNGGYGGSSNWDGGTGGDGGDGGGIYNSNKLLLLNCTLSKNITGLGSGGGGTAGYGNGGTGGNGGDGSGIFSSGIASLINCTLSGNTAGSGGAGGYDPLSKSNGGVGGNGGAGGGIFTSGNASLVCCTLSGNASGIGGVRGLLGPSDGLPGLGGGFLNNNSASIRVRNTIIASNPSPGSAPDVSGTFISEGCNLIGIKDGSTGFGQPGDIVGSSSSPVDPKLGPLADNGGPTLTYALLPGSPALNAGDDLLVMASTNLQSDQRGQPRLSGPHVDIGAVEMAIAAPFTIKTIALLANGNLWLEFIGTTTGHYSIESTTSIDSPNWVSIATGTNEANGIVTFEDAGARQLSSRYYRVVKQ